jgi:hypothetical protein
MLLLTCVVLMALPSERFEASAVGLGGGIGWSKSSWKPS